MLADDFFAAVTARQESSGVFHKLGGYHVVPMTLEEAQKNVADSSGAVSQRLGLEYEGIRIYERVQYESDKEWRNRNREKRSQYQREWRARRSGNGENQEHQA